MVGTNILFIFESLNKRNLSFLKQIIQLKGNKIYVENILGEEK